MSDRPPQRTPNRRLASLITEAGFSSSKPRPQGGPARPGARPRPAVRQDLRDPLAARPAAPGDHPRADRRGLHPAARAPPLRTGPGPRRMRPGLRGPGVRGHARGGGRHRQRAVAEGLGQPCGAAQDRLHPGRARRPQQGLADRPGRRVGGAGQRARDLDARRGLRGPRDRGDRRDRKIRRDRWGGGGRRERWCRAARCSRGSARCPVRGARRSRGERRGCPGRCPRARALQAVRTLRTTGIPHRPDGSGPAGSGAAGRPRRPAATAVRTRPRPAGQRRRRRGSALGRRALPYPRQRLRRRPRPPGARPVPGARDGTHAPRLLRGGHRAPASSPPPPT